MLMNPGNKQPRHFSNLQIGFLFALWIFLIVTILLYAEITPYTIFLVVASGIIIFVPIYKAHRRERKNLKK